MKKNLLPKVMLGMVFLALLLLLGTGCGGSEGKAADALANQKDGSGAEQTSETMITSLSDLSADLSARLETINGATAQDQTQKIIDRLSQSKLANISDEQLATLKSNQQQINTLAVTVAKEAADLAAILKQMQESGETLTAQQLVQLERLLTEYETTITALMTEVEGLKAQLVDGVDIKNLANYSVDDLITLQNRELQALTTLDGFIGEVMGILNQ